MDITTNEQAKQAINNWLTENHHDVKEITDDAASFHFEVYYPVGSLKREREKFYADIRKDLIFLKNSYDFNLDEEGIVKQVQFSYEFYFDSLTKTRIFEGLLLNHRTLLYIVTKFNEKFGI